MAVVICGLLVLPAGASASSEGDALVRKASRLSGLHARRVIPTATLAAARYDAAFRRAANRNYPRWLRDVDARLYALLGLAQHSTPVQLLPRTSAAWYDPAARKLLLRGVRPPAQARVINELVRALVDQNFGLRRIAGLRSRDRDAALAAQGIVEGTAALASGLRAPPLHGGPAERFLELEASAGLGPGRTLAADLRYLGGVPALASALRAFPQTTEQLLHVDKFLERERALPVQLPARIDAARLTASETFGELDVRDLLRAYRVPDAGVVASGWGGGRMGLYLSPSGEYTAALELRWDTVVDAEEWRDAVPQFVASAFPAATARDCPPLDRCWSAGTELAAGVLGDRSVLASGPRSDLVAAALMG